MKWKECKEVQEQQQQILMTQITFTQNQPFWSVKSNGPYNSDINKTNTGDGNPSFLHKIPKDDAM